MPKDMFSEITFIKKAPHSEGLFYGAFRLTASHRGTAVQAFVTGA